MFLGTISPEAAIGIVASLVAIVGTSLTIASRQRVPRLSLDYGGPPKDAITVEVDYFHEAGRTVPSHWLRVRVKNRGGRRRRSAKRVEVQLVDAFRLLDRWREIVPLDAVALIWSNQSEDLSFLDIPPGSERRADVAVLRWPQHQIAIPQSGSVGCWGELRVLPVPSSNRNHLQPGRYLLNLMLTGEDVPARRYRAVLKISGFWRPGSDVWDTDFLLEDFKRDFWWRRRPT